MQLSDYATKYQGINFTRSASGVLEITIHTRGGPAKWGTSLSSLHTELGDAFLDIARDNANKVVIFTGTGDSFIAEFDREENYPEPSLAAMWPRIYDEGNALLSNLLAIPVPMIAAVNGPALIHAELPVVADIVLAAESAGICRSGAFSQRHGAGRRCAYRLADAARPQSRALFPADGRAHRRGGGEAAGRCRRSAGTRRRCCRARANWRKAWRRFPRRRCATPARCWCANSPADVRRAVQRAGA